MPRSRSLYFVFLLSLSAMMATVPACSGSESPDVIESGVPKIEDKASVVPAVEGSNALACAMYKRLAGQGEPGGNLFFSPISVSTALMLAYEGARGETRAEFERVLGLQGIETLDAHRAYGKLFGELRDEQASHELVLANGLWGEQTVPFRDAYLDTLTAHYEAGFASVDFKNDADAQRRGINRWVQGKTRDRIKGLLPEGALSPDTRLVLVNAIYFKARWAHEFSERTTRDEPFYLLPADADTAGGSVEVPMMRHRQTGYMHGDFDGYNALRLYYLDGVSMLVLLPDDKSGLPALESMLAPRLIEQTIAGLSYETVNLWLPKWEMTLHYALAPVLKAMGMTTAFDEQLADLSGMSDSPRSELFFLSNVFHKAFIKVDEEGTEAAAATALVAEDAAEAYQEEQKIYDFRCDHPFVYLIIDNRTGAILFMGRVTDPS